MICMYMYDSYTSTVGQYRTYPLGFTHNGSGGSRSPPYQPHRCMVYGYAIELHRLEAPGPGGGQTPVGERGGRTRWVLSPSLG